ncbi:MAG: hypothetical protein RLZZ308_731 [Candidatus Parcubacteria bacterium]|jgi:predicted ferric reductase
MKAIFRFLQRLDVAVMLAVVFIAMPSAVTYVATTFGVDVGLVFHTFLSVIGVLLTIFLFWALTAKWNIEKLGLFIVSAGAGLGGVIIAFNLFAGIYQWITPSWFEYFHRMGTLTVIVTAVWGTFLQYVYIPWIKNN